MNFFDYAKSILGASYAAKRLLRYSKMIQRMHDRYAASKLKLKILYADNPTSFKILKIENWDSAQQK